MKLITSRRFALIVFIHFVRRSVYCYETFYMLDGCKDDSPKTINMHSGHSNSSGMLSISSHGLFVPNVNCDVVVKPPLAYDVVLSIRFMDIPPHKTNDAHCVNYFEIHRKGLTSLRFCGYSNDILEYESYESSGPMKISLHTENITDQDSSLQFHFIFTTSIKANKERCPSRHFSCDKGNCVWQGLKCDGHNNCGDLSDESEHAECLGGGNSMGQSIVVILGTIVACCVLVFVAVWVRHCAMKVKSTDTNNRRDCRRTGCSHGLVTRSSPVVNSACISTSTEISIDDPPPKYEDLMRSTTFVDSPKDDFQNIHSSSDSSRTQ